MGGQGGDIDSDEEAGERGVDNTPSRRGRLKPALRGPALGVAEVGLDGRERRRVEVAAPAGGGEDIHQVQREWRARPASAERRSSISGKMP
jgi:hypothetical protein